MRTNRTVGIIGALFYFAFSALYIFFTMSDNYNIKCPMWVIILKIAGTFFMGLLLLMTSLVQSKDLKKKLFGLWIVPTSCLAVAFAASVAVIQSGKITNALTCLLTLGIGILALCISVAKNYSPRELIENLWFLPGFLTVVIGIVLFLNGVRDFGIQKFIIYIDILLLSVGMFLSGKCMCSYVCENYEAKYKPQEEDDFDDEEFFDGEYYYGDEAEEGEDGDNDETGEESEENV